MTEMLIINTLNIAPQVFRTAALVNGKWCGLKWQRLKHFGNNLKKKPCRHRKNTPMGNNKTLTRYNITGSLVEAIH